MSKVVVGSAAKAKIGQLRRYIVTLSSKKGKPFFIHVSHAKHRLSGRTLRIGALAKKRLASGGNIIKVSYSKAKNAFSVTILHPSLGTKALKLASAQVGYHESPAGSNMTKFGLWFGMNGEPWCAIFLSWVLSHAGRPFKYSYVPYVVNDARAKRNGLSTIMYSQVPAALKAGNVVLACYDWPGESPGVADHIGMVAKVVGPTTFEAIEGNTSLGNNSNGGEVMRRTRYVSEVQAFVLVSK